MKTRRVLVVTINIDHFDCDGVPSRDDINRTLTVLRKMLELGCPDGTHTSRIIRAAEHESRGVISLCQDKLPIVK